MLQSYTNDPNQQMSNAGSNYNYNAINQQATPTLNSYGTDYVNTVKENRSKYGNYLDNALSYDPHKEHKSAFNVVYESNVYNPWGKPGGGAPKLNNNTGQLQTKIAGTLQWNLNGETEADRIARSMNNRSSTNQNLQMFKKNAIPAHMSPRSFTDAVRTNTTYNYNFREPIGPPGSEFNQSVNQQAPQPTQSQGMPSFPQSSPGRMMNQNTSFDLTTKLDQEAQQRSLNRSGTMGDNLRPKGFSELNRLANRLNTDNQPTNEYPNMSMWFGRTGQHKTSIENFKPVAGMENYSNDPRRRKLMDQLEHRSPRDVPKVYGLDNSNLPAAANLAFVNDPHSNHRNMYENTP